MAKSLEDKDEAHDPEVQPLAPQHRAAHTGHQAPDKIHTHQLAGFKASEGSPLREGRAC